MRTTQDNPVQVSMETSHPRGSPLLKQDSATKLIVQTSGEYFSYCCSPADLSLYCSSCRSDLSEKSFRESSRRDMRASTTYSGLGLRNFSTVDQGAGRTATTSSFNKSLPNMTAALPKAPKIYPIHLLLTSNYRLPNDVDRYEI